MSELRKTEAALEDVKGVLNSISENHLDANSCTEYRSVETKLKGELNTSVEKLQKRSKKIDVETGEPFYGPKTLARIAKVCTTFEELVAQVAELEGPVATAEADIAAAIARASRDEKDRKEQEKQDALAREKQEEENRRKEEALRQEEEKREFNRRLVEATAEIQAVNEEEIRNDPMQILKRRLREEQDLIVNTVFPGESSVREQLARIGESKGDRQSALGLLEMFLRNIVAYPENELYRTIKCDNPHFSEKLASASFGRECMIALGFELCIRDEAVVYYMPEPDTMSEMEAWVTWFDTIKLYHELIKESINE